MDWFTMIKGFYDKNLWTKEQVYDAVVKQKITSDQFKTITGEDYSD